MHLLRELASSGTSSSLGCGFLITLSSFYHLNGLEQCGSLSTMLKIVVWFRLVGCEGYGIMFTPQEIEMSNSSGMSKATWSALG